MVWECGKNGRAHSQEWSMARRVAEVETEVRQDGWCEGGLGKRDDDGSCASMRERS